MWLRKRVSTTLRVGNVARWREGPQKYGTVAHAQLYIVNEQYIMYSGGAVVAYTASIRIILFLFFYDTLSFGLNCLEWEYNYKVYM